MASSAAPQPNRAATWQYQVLTFRHGQGVPVNIGIYCVDLSNPHQDGLITQDSLPKLAEAYGEAWHRKVIRFLKILKYHVSQGDLDAYWMTMPHQVHDFIITGRPMQMTAPFELSYAALARSFL